MQSMSTFTTDTDQELIQIETKFLSDDRKFIKFTNEDWWSNNINDFSCLQTADHLSYVIPKNVLYSRITNNWYVLKGNLSIDDLEEQFANTGHTLGIDYTKSYIRYLAFDIDCMCRKIKDFQDHNEINNVILICVNLVRILLSLKLIETSTCEREKILEKSDEQLYSIMDEYIAVWSNGCGYHLYTSFKVSITLHHYILNKLKANMTICKCNIEIPTIMPLPYSAKQINVPYTPAKLYQVKPGIAITTSNDGEIIDYSDNISIVSSNGAYVDGVKAITISTEEDSFSGSKSIYYNNKIIKTHLLPVYPNLTMIGKLHNSHETDLLCDYIRNMSKIVHDFMATLGFDNSNNNSLLPYQNAGGVLSDEIENKLLLNHVDTKFDKYKTSNVNYLIKSFMIYFNKNFIDNIAVDHDAQYFISYLYQDGYMYLQHGTVMLHYWMLEHIIDVTQLTHHVVVDKLRELLEVNNAEITLCIEEFLTYYSDTTLLAYRSESYEMIHHFAFLKIYQISPFINLTQILKTICKIQFGTEEEFNNSISDKPTKFRLEKYHQLFNFYCDVLCRLSVVLKSTSDSNYILSDQVYVLESQNTMCPNILSCYIRENCRFSTNSEIMKAVKLNQATMDPQNIFTTTEFQFQTNVGTFNSITGLYSAPCKFLRFSRKRNFGIWYNPFQDNLRSDDTQNQKCVQMQKWMIDFNKKIPQFVDNFYFDAVFIPAILHIGLLSCVQEKSIGAISKLLLDSEDFPEWTNFIVEYYQFHPVYVYLISWIYSTYDGFITLSDYNSLRNHTLQHKIAGGSDWYDLLLPIARQCTYNKFATTHMEKLSSISDKKTILNLYEPFIVKITIFILMLLRCDRFKKFNQACASICNTIDNGTRNEDFEILLNMDKTKIPSTYIDLVNKLTTIKRKQDLIDIYKENFRITKNRVFRDISKCNLSFDSTHVIRDRIIDTFMMLCISCFFDRKLVENVIDCFSLLFISKNVKKKFILFYGKGNTGKSVFCNIVKIMLEPYAGVFIKYEDDSLRANVSTMYNGVILNEVSSLDGSLLKSQTGNDAESAKRFHKTTYETRNTQALFYGATNNFITFKKSKDQDIDPVTIDRLHVMELTGEQIDANPDNVTDFLHMLLNNQVYKSTLLINENNIQSFAHCVALMSFINYKQRRSTDDYSPVLNVNIPSSIYYRSETFKLNNKLYRFLFSLGFQREDKFYITKSELYRIVYRAILKSKKRNKKLYPYSNIEDFINAFETEFKVDLRVLDNTPVSGIQQYALIQHIKDNLRVQEAIGSVITSKDLDIRINYMFNSNQSDGNSDEPEGLSTNKENAKFYMQCVCIDKYDRELDLYRDIAFMQDTTAYVTETQDTIDDNGDVVGNGSSVLMNTNTNNILTIPQIESMTVDDCI